MKKIEIILVFLALFALTIKMFHLPASDILIVLSLSLVSMIYFYLGFALFNNVRLRKIFKKKSYENISTKRIFGAIGAGLALSFFNYWNFIQISIMARSNHTIRNWFTWTYNSDDYFSN